MTAPPRCQCPDVASSPAYHGGRTDRCPREPADHGDVVTSPALCLPCLHGCDIAGDGLDEVRDALASVTPGSDDDEDRRDWLTDATRAVRRALRP